MTQLPGIKVTLTRARAEQIVAAFNSGAPLTPTGDQWTGDDMLALAGACLFGARSQGPTGWGSDEDGFGRNMIGAMLTYAKLFELAADREFEGEHGEHVLALVSIEPVELPDITVQVIARGRLQ